MPRHIAARRTPSRFPSGGRGTSTRSGSAPSAARTAATRPPSRRASDRPRSRCRAPSRAAPCRRARRPLRDPRRGAPPSRTPSPRSTATSIAGRGREHLGPGAPARDCGDEVAAGVLHGPRRPAGLEVAIAGRLPLRQPPLPHEPADRRAVPGVALLLDEPVAGPPRRMALLSRSREAVGEHLGDPSRERVDRGLRPLGCQRRRGRQVPRARVPHDGIAADTERAGDLGRPGSVGARSSDTLSYVKGHGRSSFPPPGGWSWMSVPPGELRVMAAPRACPTSPASCSRGRGGRGRAWTRSTRDSRTRACSPCSRERPTRWRTYCQSTTSARASSSPTTWRRDTPSCCRPAATRWRPSPATCCSR